jgi:SAM-dependent methyltransferase
MIDRSLNYGRHLIERFLRAAPFQSVLDIGAGHGDDLLIARSVNPGAQLIGLEAYAPYQEELRRKGVEVHSINIEQDRFPFADASLDIVMGNQILEHTKEVFWIFDQLSRILKVGGRMILGVPNLAALHNRILLALGRQPSPLKNNSAHVRGFTKGDLIELLESGFPGGYQLAGFGGSNFYPFPPPLARPLAAAFPSMAWGIFLHFKKVRPYTGSYLRYPVEQQLETNFYTGPASQPASPQQN